MPKTPITERAISFYVPEVLWNRLKTVAERRCEGRVSQAAREAIARYLATEEAEEQSNA